MAIFTHLLSVFGTLINYLLAKVSNKKAFITLCSLHSLAVPLLKFNTCLFRSSYIICFRSFTNTGSTVRGKGFQNSPFNLTYRFGVAAVFFQRDGNIKVFLTGWYFQVSIVTFVHPLIIYGGIPFLFFNHISSFILFSVQTGYYQFYVAL